MLKEKLMTVLGGFGMVLWYIISVGINILPLFAINGPKWLVFVVIVAVVFIPLPVGIPLWIWGLVCVIKTNPTSTFAIIYYIAMAIIVTFDVVDFVLRIKEG